MSTYRTLLLGPRHERMPCPSGKTGCKGPVDRSGMACAVLKPMIEFALAMVVLTTGGAAYALYAADRAPFGYEDQRGFHFAESQRERTPKDSLEMVPESTR